MKFPKVEPISGFNSNEDALLELAEKQIEEQVWLSEMTSLECTCPIAHDITLLSGRETLGSFVHFTE